MSRASDCACLACVRDELRLTESFDACDAAMARITDLSAKGLQHYSCSRGRHSYFVCYRGIPSSEGLLPRYEGQRIDGP